MTSLALSEQISALRLAAAALTDQGAAQGKPLEKVNEEVEPIRKALTKLIERASTQDLPGCVMAIHRLRSQAQAHDKDASFLIQKAQDAQTHAEAIENAVIAAMKRDNVTQREIGGFMLTLVQAVGADGKSFDELVLR